MKHINQVVLPFALVASLTIPVPLVAGECGFQRAFLQRDEGGKATVVVYQGQPVPQLGNVRPLLFVSSLKVNTDGARTSYHQDDVTGRRCATDPQTVPCAVNNIRNAFRNRSLPVSEFEKVRDAGYPDAATWKLLNPKVIEKNQATKKPCITPDGYLVSMTANPSVADGHKREGDCDQEKWIDAFTVPAIVVPGASQFQVLGTKVRNMVVAFAPGASMRVVPGIVGDVGPRQELGEATVAMNRTLNGLPETDLPKHRPDALTRFQVERAAVLVFPGAATVLPYPITPARVASAGDEVLSKFGGAGKVYRCLKDELGIAF